MALIVANGDLLKSDCTVMAHQANCFSRMASGFAKNIVAKWPMVARVDAQYIPNAPKDKLGKCSRALVENNTVLVYNLYGQFTYGTEKLQTDYVALEKAVVMMFEEIKQAEYFKKLKIGVPFNMGCGLAGGDWSIVSEMLDRVSNTYGTDIYAYKL